MKTVFFLFATFIFLFPSGKTDAQTFAVSGYIKSQHTGDAIEYASVFEEKEGVGTISNNRGFYKLLLKSGNKSIKISDSGFHTVSTNFQLDKDTVLMVLLKPEKLKQPEPANREEAADKKF